MFFQDAAQQGQGLFLQPYCISTVHGGHVAREPPGKGLRRSCKKMPVVALSRT
ncbi:MAG: hypothetical protein V3R76_04560 [Gammaproteobacteria bacterium]